LQELFRLKKEKKKEALCFIIFWRLEERTAVPSSLRKKTVLRAQQAQA